MYPNHEEQIRRLNKVEGQVRGVREMIKNRRYCVDIVHQVKAVSAALKKVELGILEHHIQHCVREVLQTQNPIQVSDKVKEIMNLIQKTS